MNELQRQMYLSALGIDTYMPRWHLPFASVSSACVLPISASMHLTEKSNFYLNPEDTAPNIPQKIDTVQTVDAVKAIDNLIVNLLEINKIVKPAMSDGSAEVRAQINLNSASNVSLTLAAFSLSVWRPTESLMIIDSRNTKLALPTESLITNILRSFFPKKILELKNEVLRWPMIENSFVKHTIDDARTELQTWLSVQCEIRPVKYLWLMGANAATYFLPPEIERDKYLWQPTPLADIPIKALILPSCNELLQQPLQKRKLNSAFKHYHLQRHE